MGGNAVSLAPVSGWLNGCEPRAGKNIQLVAGKQLGIRAIHLDSEGAPARIPLARSSDPPTAREVRMKCQKCDRPASFHITDLVDGKPSELHLCEECAQSFLSRGEEEATDVLPAMAGLLAQQLAVGETADQLARLDQRACPVCGVTFLEFRKQGRLGCPHDYVFFSEELEPLLMNIHDQIHHIGKVPKRCSSGADQQTQLIRLRREMKEAIAKENYEQACVLRDEISTIEEKFRAAEPAPEPSEEFRHGETESTE